jgi:hypothetical protein
MQRYVYYGLYKTPDNRPGNRVNPHTTQHPIAEVLSVEHHGGAGGEIKSIQAFGVGGSEG